jgi:hypothetical protein
VPPAEAGSGFSLALLPRANQVAEKVFRAVGKDAGAKAHVVFSVRFGTTKVMP